MSKLFFRYGAMNSGKTTSLLQVAHNYKEKGMEVLIIKPSIDTKGQEKIVSRLGIEREVDALLKTEDGVMAGLQYITDQGKDATLDEELSKFMHTRKRILDTRCILVDEAQFLTPGQVDELYWITKKFDIPVICYGLRCDFMMMGFPGATRLLEIADDIEELKTICSCGSKATQNLRKVNGTPIFEGDQVCIDNQDSVEYEGVCGKCYLKLRRKL
jgi:thymidine kinase